VAIDHALSVVSNP